MSSNMIIAHLARQYTARELAEAIIRMDTTPQTHYWRHLEAVRIERAPVRIRELERRLAVAEKRLKRTKPLGPAYERALSRVCTISARISCMRHELEHLAGKAVSAAGGTP